MIDDIKIYGTPEAAQQLGIALNTLQVWIHRNPEYRPKRRFSGDDLLWTVEDIERVKAARERRPRKAK